MMVHVSLDVPLTIEVPKAPKRMIEVLDESGTTHIKINNSSLSIIQACPRKAYYALHRGLVAKTESSATLFGSAVHAALEVFYRGSRTERVLPATLKKDLELMAYGARLEREDEFLVYRATRAFIDRASPLLAMPPEDKRSIQAGVWILTHYWMSYIDDPYVVYVDEQGPIVERTLEMLVHEEPGLRISVFGTIDVILRNEANGQVLVCDHKTSSQVGKDFYNRLKPNHQYSGYVLMAQKVLGLDTDKFLVNCLQVKPVPKTARGEPPNFPRQVTTRSSEDLQEYVQAIVHWSKQYRTFLSENVWPIGSVESCAGYGGCQYLDVCSSPASIRENIIRNNYKGSEA